MSVKVSVRPPQRADVLIVPRRAVDFSSDVPRAKIADGEWAELDLGPCNAFECVVDEGLLEGSRLNLAQGTP